jgi:RNA-binding protein YhbY
VIVGKGGLSDAVKDEIRTQLKVKKAIKVALPAQLDDKDAFIKEICAYANAICIDLRGRKAILYRE